MTPAPARTLRPSSARWWRAPIAARIVDADVIGWAGSTPMIRAAAESRRGRPARSYQAASRAATRPARSTDIGGPGARSGERRAPLVQSTVAEPDKAVDVGVRPSGQYDRDRRHERRGDPAPAQQHVDERPAHTPVAVDEGMDRLELRMGDGGLGHGRQVVAVHEIDEVEHQ